MRRGSSHRVLGGGSAAPRSLHVPNRERDRRIVEAWLAAVRDGDIRALLALLDDGAVLHADYGATRQVVEGARSIADQAVLAARLAAHSTPILIDGRPGVAAVVNGRAVSVMAFDIVGDRIVALDVLGDPERLTALGVDAFG